MSKIVDLSKYTIVVTHTWHNSIDHGICGHTFEIIDYFWVIKDFFNACILMVEDISPKTFENAIRSKYNFTDNEIDCILSHTVFKYKPLLLKCNNVLIVDGNLQNINSKNIIFNKAFLFACGYIPIKNNKNKKVYVLQDHRIYEKAEVNSIEYVKKILFSRMKIITKHENKTLIYATKNCRLLSDEYYLNLLKKYDDDFLVLTNKENRLSLINDRITQIDMPVPNIFEKINKYIYTPISRHFDCSPRFIAECKYYGIDVIYDDIVYHDKGLEARKSDINNIDTISLNSKDNIIDIIRENI